MQTTPNSNRLHISLYGKRNAGKSSLLNSIVGHECALVSDIKGTTTDPVSKAMEFIPFGPVVFTDTAGLDDEGILGDLRIKKTYDTILKTDIAIYIFDATDLDETIYKKILREFKRFGIPHIIVINKIDLLNDQEIKELKNNHKDAILISTKIKQTVDNFKEILLSKLDNSVNERPIIGDLLPYGSSVILVVPIDSEAPKGRLILPQVQLLRDCLDHGIKSYVVRDTELEQALKELKNVDLVITDSQAFKEVNKIVPPSIRLTSFSLLFARYKGDLGIFLEGIKCINDLNEHSKVLISECCTHNQSHEDIGRVKIPKLLQKHVGKKLDIDFSMGKKCPDNLQDYDLVIHCAACMINTKAMLSRIKICKEHNVKITNYGMILAYLNGILDRSLSIFR